MVFTASNGISIEMTTERFQIITPEYKHYISPSEEQALREFFLDERDKKLGHWRFDGNHVVFEVKQHQPHSSARLVRILHEAAGQYFERHEDKVQDAEDFYSGAARAYFEAHPVPKPWHDAKPGEVWVLTWRNLAGEEVTSAAMRTYRDKWRLAFVESSFDEPIVSGRRIWPEGGTNVLGGVDHVR